jgi:hypothetical protein
VPGVGDGLLRERALGAFDEQAVQVKGGEDGADVAQVLRPRVAEYQYIVEEDEDEAAQKRTEHVIHQCLERSRGVAQPERHGEELVEAIMCAERGLVDVVGVHPNLVVAGTEVQFGEKPRTPQLIEKFIHHRDWVRVLDGDGVERPVIEAKMP